MGTINGWKYKGNEFTEDMIDDNYGFVYFIICSALGPDFGRAYIGKKLFYSARTKKLVGKRKKRYKVISDWQDYYGSSEELKQCVEKYGKECFCREILHLCKTKGECNYLEAKEQFDRGVLENDRYFNSWIMVKVHKSHIKGLNERRTGI